jgi:two-component system capsular synthesis response regulator RcsB
MHLRVLIADDHPIVLLGVRSILQANDILVVGEASSPEGLLAELNATSCDVVVTDLVMPAGRSPDGIPMIRQIRAEHPLLPVVIMTMVGNIGIIDALLRAGVLGVVEKSEEMDALAQAVRAAASRRQFVSAGLKLQLDAYRYDVHEAKLSPRESEVLRMLASGLSVTEVAVRLGRSMKTISRQKVDGMRKLGLESDVQLYEYARDHGLL